MESARLNACRLFFIALDTLAILIYCRLRFFAAYP